MVWWQQVASQSPGTVQGHKLATQDTSTVNKFNRTSTKPIYCYVSVDRVQKIETKVVEEDLQCECDDHVVASYMYIPVSTFNVT